jgi:hypothetical protein
MLSRVRSQFEKALGALMVARQGRGSCPTLDEMLSGWDGRFQPLWRKRVARHIADCDACATVEKREMSPAALLAVTPFLAAPAVVRSRLLEDRTELVAYSRMLVERAGPFDADGFPGLPPPERRRRGLLALVVALLLLFGGVAVVQSLTGDPEDGLIESALVTPKETPTTSPPTSYVVAPQETIRPRPSTVVEPIEDPSLTPSPTVTTTAPSPTVSTTPPNPPPTTKAPPKPTTSAPVPLGRLTASPRSFTLTLDPRAGPSSATVTLTANDGPVTWTASRSGPITLSDTGASLSPGESSSVTVTLNSTATGPVTVTVSVSGHHVTISASYITPG